MGSFSTFLGVQTYIDVEFIWAIYDLEHGWREAFRVIGE